MKMVATLRELTSLQGGSTSGLNSGRNTPLRSSSPSPLGGLRSRKVDAGSQIPAMNEGKDVVQRTFIFSRLPFIVFSDGRSVHRRAFLSSR